MRVAIVSDVHSNLPALEAVLEDSARRGAADLWCLGDIVGYGPEPRECLAIIRQRASLCLSGNHDLGAIGKLSLDEFNGYAAMANQWTGQVLTAEEKEWLGGLPNKLEWEDVTLAHASPREPVWEYVLSVPSAMAAFEHFETRICFIGHSHVPFVVPEPDAGRWCAMLPFPEEGGARPGDRRLIVNPGSVGQPRDRDPRASYAIYDMDDDIVYNHRVAYDVEETQRRMRLVCLPQYLIDRLSRGA